MKKHRADCVINGLFALAEILAAVWFGIRGDVFGLLVAVALVLAFGGSAVYYGWRWRQHVRVLREMQQWRGSLR